MVRVAQRPSVPTQPQVPQRPQRTPQPDTDYDVVMIPSGDGSMLARTMPRDMSIEPETKPHRRMSDRPEVMDRMLAEGRTRDRVEGAAAVRDTRALLDKPTVYAEGDTAVSGVRPSDVEPSPMEKKALEAQLAKNSRPVTLRRNALKPAERARYEALDAKLGDDPDTRLSLQRMLLDGRLDAARLGRLTEAAEKDPAWRQRVREEATPARRRP